MGCGQSKINIYSRKHKGKHSKKGKAKENDATTTGEECVKLETAGIDNVEYANENAASDDDNVMANEHDCNDDMSTDTHDLSSKIKARSKVGGPLVTHSEISDSQVNFFKMLDEKIENGKDYDSSSETEVEKENQRLTELLHDWELASHPNTPHNQHKQYSSMPPQPPPSQQRHTSQTTTTTIADFAIVDNNNSKYHSGGGGGGQVSNVDKYAPQWKSYAMPQANFYAPSAMYGPPAAMSYTANLAGQLPPPPPSSSSLSSTTRNKMTSGGAANGVANNALPVQQQYHHTSIINNQQIKQSLSNFVRERQTQYMQQQQTQICNPLSMQPPPAHFYRPLAAAAFDDMQKCERLMHDAGGQASGNMMGGGRMMSSADDSSLTKQFGVQAPYYQYYHVPATAAAVANNQSHTLPNPRTANTRQLLKESVPVAAMLPLDNNLVAHMKHNKLRGASSDVT